MSTRILALFALTAFTISHPAWSLDPSVKKLVQSETEANPAVQQSSRPIRIENYEISLSALSLNDVVRDRIPKEILQSLVFTKNGKKYIRWIINPTDVGNTEKLEQYLVSRHLSIKRYKYFTGYRTASRSLILEDPKSHVAFSIKSSTDQPPRAPGFPQLNKTWTLQEAKEARLVTDYLQSIQDEYPFEHVIIMDEPASFGIGDGKEMDQALTVRLLEDLQGSQKYYLPGFAVFDSRIGNKIAALNGSNDPADFWNEHYNKALGRALGEFAARTGVLPESSHSQNFLIELDENMKPTGRIIFRDPDDPSVHDPFFKATGRTGMVKVGRGLKSQYESHFYFTDVRVSWGVLSGNRNPSWGSGHTLSDQDAKSWYSDFTSEFENEYATVTGIPIDRLKGSLNTAGSGWNDATNGAYRTYSIGDEFAPYFKKMKQRLIARKRRMGELAICIKLGLLRR